MKKIISISIILLILSIGFSAKAAQQEAFGTTITQMYAYTQTGNGDVQISVADSVTNCSGGFWLSPEDDGYDSTLSFLLSAYHAGSSIHIIGEDSQTWPASSAPACRLIAVGVI